MAASLREYGIHIAEKMALTQANVAVAWEGDFRGSWGCIDKEVQEKFPTDLTLAGVLAYWEANGRGGARSVLEHWTEKGIRNKTIEFHYPCGQLLLELGIDTWAGQAEFVGGLVHLVNSFNKTNRTDFKAKVHANVGTAGPYLR